MTVIYSPEEGFTGPGVGGLQFEDGRAETDDKAIIRYARKAGYGIDEEPASAEDAPEQPDARAFAEAEQVGTRLRDAAVDPRPEDFLPPTNAGEADPHGPLVVAPGIHAAETGPIHAGDVHVDDPELQEAQETALDTAVFVEGEDVTDATRAAAAENEVERPAQSAAKADWVDYAVTVDAELSREDAEAMTKAQLIEAYGTDTASADDTNKEA